MHESAEILRDPGEFVQMPIQTSSNLPGCKAEEFCQITYPLGTTARTSVPVNAQMYEFYTKYPAMLRLVFKVYCISAQLTSPNSCTGSFLFIYIFLLSLKVFRAVM